MTTFNAMKIDKMVKKVHPNVTAARLPTHLLWGVGDSVIVYDILHRHSVRITSPAGKTILKTYKTLSLEIAKL